MRRREEYDDVVEGVSDSDVVVAESDAVKDSVSKGKTVSNEVA